MVQDWCKGGGGLLYTPGSRDSVTRFCNARIQSCNLPTRRSGGMVPSRKMLGFRPSENVSGAIKLCAGGDIESVGQTAAKPSHHSVPHLSCRISHILT